MKKAIMGHLVSFSADYYCQGYEKGHYTMFVRNSRTFEEAIIAIKQYSKKQKSLLIQHYLKI